MDLEKGKDKYFKFFFDGQEFTARVFEYAINSVIQEEKQAIEMSARMMKCPHPSDSVVEIEPDRGVCCMCGAAVVKR